jgi:hypothetical protein
MAVLISLLANGRGPPDARAKHLEAFRLLPSITPLPYEAPTPHPLISPPVGGTSLGPSAQGCDRLLSIKTTEDDSGPDLRAASYGAGQLVAGGWECE